MAEVVRAEIGAISLQSVYDALGVLVDEGLVRRIQPAGSPARFEDRVGDNHHHLICRVCGRVVDIDCAVGSAPCLTAADDMGYEIDEAEVVYWGRCPECVAQARTTRNAARDHPRAGVAAGRNRTSRCNPSTVEVNVNMDNEKKCPFTGQSAQRQVEPRLVAEPAEPEGAPPEPAPAAIRWARSSTTPRSSRPSTSMP